MRALRLKSYGTTPVVEEVDEPKVSAPLDVIVEVAAAGLCRTDLHIIAGQLAAAGTQVPMTLGHENAGFVREVGSAVGNVVPGDLVILHPTPTCGLCAACRAGNDMHCVAGSFPGLFCDGGMADLVLTNARACVKLPSDVDPVSVAAHADAGLTAYHAVKRALPYLRPGSVCAVIGAGGLGHIGVQCLAALTGARIVVVDRKQGALELACSVGAHHGVVADGGQVAAVRALTDDEGVDVVIDFVGEEGAEAESLKMLRRGGLYFVVGYGGVLSVPTFDLVLNEITVVGNLVGTFADLTELMALQRLGQVELHTEIYKLSDAADAIAALDAGRVRGRAVLVP